MTAVKREKGIMGTIDTIANTVRTSLANLGMEHLFDQTDPIIADLVERQRELATNVIDAFMEQGLSFDEAYKITSECGFALPEPERQPQVGEVVRLLGAKTTLMTPSHRALWDGTIAEVVAPHDEYGRVWLRSLPGQHRPDGGEVEPWAWDIGALEILDGLRVAGSG